MNIFKIPTELTIPDYLIISTFTLSVLLAFWVAIVYFIQWKKGGLNRYGQNIVLGIAFTGVGIGGFHFTHLFHELSQSVDNMTYVSLAFLLMTICGYILHIFPFIANACKCLMKRFVQN